MPARREALRLELVVVDGEHRDPYEKAGRQVHADGEPDVLKHHRRRRRRWVQSAGVAFSRRGGAISEESMGQGGGGLDYGSACVGGGVGAVGKGLGFARSGVGLGRVTFVGCGLK